MVTKVYNHKKLIKAFVEQPARMEVAMCSSVRNKLCLISWAILFSLLLGSCAPSLNLPTTSPVPISGSSSIPATSTLAPFLTPTAGAETTTNSSTSLLIHPKALTIMYGDRATDNGDGTFTVNLPTSDYDAAHPPMVSYIWHLNPNVDAGVDNIVIKFKMSATGEEEIHGYSRGFFPMLYCLDPVNTGTPITDSTGMIDTDVILHYPEFGEPLDAFTMIEGEDVTITIPYEQLKSGRTSIVLSFLPGTTFSAPEATVTGTGRFFGASIIEELIAAPSLPVYDIEPVIRSYWHAPQFDYNFYNIDDHSGFRNFVNLFGPELLRASYDAGIFYMPVSDYADILGENYATEVSGPYAVVPDGLPVLLHSASVYLPGAGSSEQVLSKQQRLAVSNFIKTHMVDSETGLIHGIWDIEQGRVVANLPIAASLANDDPAFAQQLLTAIAQYEIIEVNGKWFYAPRGINADGEVTVRLSDLAVDDSFYFNLIEGTDDKDLRLKVIEAYVNTLGLVLEAQEQTPTNLPPSEIVVTFDQDGTHTISPADGPLGTFNISNPFFTLNPYVQETVSDAVLNHGIVPGVDYAAIDRAFQRAQSLSGKQQEQALAEAWRLIEGTDAGFKLLYYNYRILYNVYTFQRQDGNFGARYDIETGQVVLLEDGEASGWEGYHARFGGPAAATNWLQISGFFHDSSMMTQSYKLAEASIRAFRDSVYRIGDDGKQNSDALAAMRENSLGVFSDISPMVIVMMQDDYLLVNARSEVPPWQLGGSLIWLMTAEEYYEYKLKQYNITVTPTPPASTEDVDGTSFLPGGR